MSGSLQGHGQGWATRRAMAQGQAVPGGSEPAQLLAPPWASAALADMNLPNAATCTAARCSPSSQPMGAALSGRWCSPDTQTLLGVGDRNYTQVAQEPMDPILPGARWVKPWRPPCLAAALFPEHREQRAKPTHLKNCPFAVGVLIPACLVPRWAKPLRDHSWFPCQARMCALCTGTTEATPWPLCSGKLSTGLHLPAPASVTGRPCGMSGTPILLL